VIDAMGWACSALIIAVAVVAYFRNGPEVYQKDEE